MLAFFSDDLFEEPLDVGAAFRIVRQEDLADTVLTFVWKLDADRRGLTTHEPIGHLKQNACAVTGVRVVPGGAAMFEVDQDLERLLDDQVRTPAVDMRYEPDTARIVFVRRIVEALRSRIGWLLHRTFIGAVQPCAKRDYEMGRIRSTDGFAMREMHGGHARNAGHSSERRRGALTIRRDQHCRFSDSLLLLMVTEGGGCPRRRATAVDQVT
jgi:hypothetical protein